MHTFCIIPRTILIIEINHHKTWVFVQDNSIRMCKASNLHRFETYFLDHMGKKYTVVNFVHVIHYIWSF